MISTKFQSDAPSAIPPGFSLLSITQTTKLKTKPEDSSQLAPYQQVELLKGQTFYILGYACIEGHFRVTFSKKTPGFGTTGYLYWQHVKITKDGKEVRFDPNAVLLTILKNTALKKRPADPATLKPAEKISLPAGMVYGVAGYLLEAGNLKVSLTENIPGFGNTGYLSPDAVQLSRGGNSLSDAQVTGFNGPTEVLAKQPTTLTGTFDPLRVASVELVAEDKYPLAVTLNRSQGTWQVKLSQGFQEPGARWLRLKGKDSTGLVVSSQLVNITVSKNATTVGKSLTLKTLKDTFFKVAPVDSSSLNSQQKVLVKAGKTFGVSQYGLAEGHLKITLSSPLEPVGNFGYFYEPYVQLSKGNQILKFDIDDVPDTHVSAQMLVTEATSLKAAPVDSSELAKNQKYDLTLGQVYAISGYASIKGHYRVTLTQSIPGFGNVGYVYWRHVKIKKFDRVVTYDPNALTATVLQPTVLKKKPVDASQLSNTEKIALPVGRVYGVASYTLEEGHIKVSLTEQLQQFGNTGYLYPSHIQMRRGGTTFDPFPNQVELNVPYFSQRDNPRFYWSTCNVTSIAMAFYYYGIRSNSGGQLEDELLEWCVSQYGEGSQTDHTVLSELIRAYGFKTSFSANRTWSEVKNELNNGRPFVLAGDFTASGHVICGVGHTSEGLIVNDPWGDALTGYSDTEGGKLLYPYGYLNQVAGPDGNIWAHFIQP
ncbi:C39 family peptidase [Kamptonema formosum]|uniref:C39 family peptidase n=1 Tax=Kamptonema formosum TaxID=331992 RepID=UPI00034CFE0B|nr:C39 family peptidase [Oscillatoria sp. PCC 10802]